MVADLVDLARGLDSPTADRVPHLAFQADQLNDLAVLPIAEIESGYYLRRGSPTSQACWPTSPASGRQWYLDRRLIQREPAEGEDQTDVICSPMSAKSGRCAWPSPRSSS